VTGRSKTYQGSCHCGAVQFSATTDLSGLFDCNGSRCRRLGWVMQPVSAEDLAMISGACTLKTYRFNTEKIEHLFCPACGIEPFARGADKTGKLTCMVNVNCLEDVPAFERPGVRHWDGASF
jgi:hypothetical protein